MSMPARLSPYRNDFLLVGFRLWEKVTRHFLDISTESQPSK